jgi:uncharacterized protein (TIGR02246 family)
MRRLPFLIGVFLLFAFAPARAETAREAIETALVAFAEAFNRGDAAAVASHYAEDAAVFPPGAPRIDGRANIQIFWQGGLDAGLKNLTLKAIEITEQGDWAYEVGELTVSVPGSGGASQMQNGKYVVIWKKDSEGKWRLYRDIWNSNQAESH